MDEWKLADAKNRFSELVDKACTEGPQVVTKNGKKTVVVVPYEHFEKERVAENRRFVEHLLAIPQVASDEEWNEIFGDTRPKRHARPDPFQDK